MRIVIDKNVVEFLPETGNETENMETLWRLIVDCIKENKKLVPIGEYIHTKKNLARFVIEDIGGGITQYVDRTSTQECTYYCTVCDKYMNVKTGDTLPICCGRPIDIRS